LQSLQCVLPLALGTSLTVGCPYSSCCCLLLLLLLLLSPLSLTSVLAGHTTHREVQELPFTWREHLG
jgi:hypothetical protein